MTQMIDMAQVFAGFINHHPGKAKGRQEDYHSYPQPWDFHNDLVCERLAPWAGQIYTIQRSQPSQKFIFDHYILDVSTQWGQYIGIHCTVPKNNTRTRWEPYVPIVARNIDIDNWQNEGPWIRGPINSQDPCGILRKQALQESPCQYDKNLQCMGWGYEIFDVNVYNFGGECRLKVVYSTWHRLD